VILVDAENVSASRPGRPLFENLSVTVSSGDRLGIVGLNGFGKSTLLRVLTGEQTPESGVVRHGRGLRIATLEQDPVLPPGSVAEVVGAGWEAAAALDRLGMGSEREADVSTLSGGQAKRVALARALVGDHDLLVLDEPTNHLDIDGIAWLESHLAAHRGGLVLVTHDRHLLDRVTTRMLELDRGAGYVHEGGYSAYLEARAEREQQAADAEHRRRNLARDELRWLRRGAPARTRKPKADVAVAQRIIDGAPPPSARPEELDLHFDTPRLGDQVVEFHDVSFAHSGDRPLFAGVDLLIDRRERLGIVGLNGSGKTTLLDVVAGRRAPTGGRLVTGSTVRLGYYRQQGPDLDPSLRVREALTGRENPHWSEVALLERFWFDSDAQWAPVELLSGGERRRLQLVSVLASHPNVLLLDEPTNDLDLDTLRVLEDFLDDWPGALLVASHDRAFLERTVTDVIVLDGRGEAARVPGGYQAWEDERRGRHREAPARSGGRPPAGGRPPPRPPGSTRSPSTVKQELKRVDRRLAQLTERRDQLTEALAEETDDHQRLAAVGLQLTDLNDQLAAAEDEWLLLHDELDR
jgi:ATP-binding cassette subfamily F protein uup